MPRPHRNWVSGAIYHVTVRGNNRQMIFLDDVDYQRYLIELRQCREEEPYHLLAFALMPNHVHLVIEAAAGGSFSRVMQQLSAGYTRYFNTRHGRVGHLYQGRFYSNHVDREPYLLEVTRYVHLNPVRAALVQQPVEYRWSSYRFYLGLERDRLGLVEPGAILGLFGDGTGERTERYRQFVEALAAKEHEMKRWLLRLERQRLIPPSRWLSKKVSDTSQGAGSV